MLFLPPPLSPILTFSFHFYFPQSHTFLSQTTCKPKKTRPKMNHSVPISTLLLAILLLLPAFSLAAGRKDGGFDGMFGPGSGFDGIPGFGQGWDRGIVGGGYGGGYGGPKGGYGKDGIIRNTVVCKDKGPCYNKKVTCPAKCFSSYSRSGKGFGGGGGGGGCTIDCTKKCIGYC